MGRKSHTRPALILACSSLFAATNAFAAPPQVVATIAPIHALVANIMEGVATPDLLLPSNASPHSYALKPSDAKALDRADIVFWVGEGLETFMHRPLEALADDALVVELMEVPGVTLLPVRAGGGFEAHAHDDEDHEEEAHDEEEHDEKKHGEEEHDDHDHDGSDPHIWLSIANAQAITQTIVATLARTDPTNSAAYRQNGERVDARLRGLSSQIATLLGPVHNEPYIVFHDGYQYFEQEFDLHPVGSITLHPDQPASAGVLASLQKKMSETGTTCLFREPQFEPGIIQVLVEGTSAHIGTLDPLGSSLPPGPDQYFDLMQDMAVSITNCLAPKS